MNDHLQILLVEDNPGDVDLIKERLSGAALITTRMEVVDRLSLALESIASNSFDIVILDLGLPDSNGLETIRTVRRGTATLPIVVLTGNDDEQMGLAAIQEGAQDYLVKGQIDGSQLVRAIKYAIERKRAEEVLKDNQELLRQVLENSHDSAYKRNLQTDSYDYMSPVFFRISGYTPDEIKTLPLETLMDLIHHEDLAKIKNVIAESLSNSAIKKYQTEYRFKHKDGKYRWIQDRFTVMRDGGSQPLAIIGIVRDITELKKAEEEKSRLEVQLHQARKMESVGRLAGGVAHDFNNMLSIIIGYAEMALKKLGPTNKISMDIQKILTAGQKSADLTRQLLAFARKQTIAPIVLDLNHIVGNITLMIGRLIGEEIDLLWKPSDHLAHVMMDPSQMDQILANLLVNARDAISGVGKITIETGLAEFEKDYCAIHPGFVPGRYVFLAVSDNGCGMDKKTQERIFEPFFTTKELGKGTGLGLATVFGIVRQNNGFINVYSEPGTGTTFKIYIPEHASEPEIRIKHEPIRVPAGTETVLVVEDEKALLELIIIMFEELGYPVLGANSAIQAIKLCEEFTADIHLLLTDVMMPEMSGHDLWDKLSPLRPEMKCLYMSGYTANVIAHHGILEDGVNFISKPFSKEVLAVKIREVLDG